MTRVLDGSFCKLDSVVVLFDSLFDPIPDCRSPFECVPTQVRETEYEQVQIVNCRFEGLALPRSIFRRVRNLGGPHTLRFIMLLDEELVWGNGTIAEGNDDRRLNEAKDQPVNGPAEVAVLGEIGAVLIRTSGKD